MATQGQQLTVQWQLTNASPTTTLSYALSTDAAYASQPLGSVKTAPGQWTAYYTAPSTINSAMVVTITATTQDASAISSTCTINLTPASGLGVAYDPATPTRGLIGNVYVLPSGTPALPNLDAMTSVQTLVIGNLDVPNESYTVGFPDVPGLVEWFAISFKGQLYVASTGYYDFSVTSDDGSNVYIDGTKIINNDGVHAAKTVQAMKVYLTAGMHVWRVDYYQGPRYQIELDVWWRPSGVGSFVVIPPSVFYGPATASTSN